MIMLLTMVTYPQASKGFQYSFVPNVSQYDHSGFYITGSKIITGGSTGGFPSGGTIMTSDTLGVIGASWSFVEANGLTPMKIRNLDANNTIITGKDYMFPQSPFVAIFNHTTGTFSSAYYYNHSTNGFGSGDGTASDAIKLSTGDLAIVGLMNENLPSTPGVSNMGVCSGPATGYGFMAGSWGTNNYGRGQDVFLIRTGANGDTASSASGFVKKYSLAYCGGGYTPPVPEVPGHATGNFCYQFFPSWMADSTRHDVGVSLLEAGGNLFIGGYSQDYYSASVGSTRDYEAFIIKTNLSGTVQWVRTYYLRTGASPYEYGLGIESVTSDATNDVIMVMRSEQSGNVEVFRVANATGNIVWAKSYDFGAYDRGWGIKKTPSNTFIIGVTSTINAIGGSYDMILLEINANGGVVQSKGYGTTNMDGTDSWAWLGPDVDVFSVGTYALAGVTNYSGGTTGGTLMIKANRNLNSSGCTSNQFTATATVTDRNSGGANQLFSRKPLIYETKGGGTKGTLTLTPTVITPSVTSTKICILPIELLHFSGTLKNNSVYLNWVTKSEINNDYFIIEKSSDGKNFIELGKVKGSGSSSVTNEYNLVDEKPFEGVSYYRLKQVDYDGSTETFNVIAVEIIDSEELTIKMNPNSGNYVINGNFKTLDNYKIEIVGVTGQVVFSDNLESYQGQYNREIDLKRFGKGVYFICMVNSKEKQTKRILVF